MAITTEIHVKAPALQAAVGWAAKWAAAKPVVPIQAGLRLSVQGGTLSVSAYSENANVRTSLDAAPILEDEHSTVVSARLLDAVAKTLAARAPVTLVSSPEGLVVTQGRSVLTLPAMPEQDWPTLSRELPTIGTVSGAALAQAVHRASAAAPADPSKAAALAAMWLELGASEIEILSSDRYQLSRNLLAWTALADAPVAITPYAEMIAAAAAAFDGPDTVRIGYDGSQMSLASDNRAMTMGTMYVEAWPAANFRKAVAMEHPEAVTLNVADLVTPLKQAALMRDKEGPIRVVIGEGVLAITAAEADGGRKAASEVDVDYAGPAVTVGLNPDYFAGALEAAPGQKVTLHFGVERRHVTLTCDDEPGWAHVLMPVLIRS